MGAPASRPTPWGSVVGTELSDRSKQKIIALANLRITEHATVSIAVPKTVPNPAEKEAPDPAPNRPLEHRKECSSRSIHNYLREMIQKRVVCSRPRNHFTAPPIYIPLVLDIYYSLPPPPPLLPLLGTTTTTPTTTTRTLIMTKRKAVTPAGRIGTTKRFRQIPARQQEIARVMATPFGGNTFFERFNLDVRNAIYNQMILPPFHGHRESAGIRFSCRQAKEEMEAEGARAFWLYLQCTIQRFEANGGVMPHLSPSIESKDNFVGIRELTLTSSNWFRTTGPVDLLRLELDVLRLHFTPEVSDCPEFTTLGFPHFKAKHYLFKTLRQLENIDELHVKSFVISWNCRPKDAPNPRTLRGGLLKMNNSTRKDMIKCSIHPNDDTLLDEYPWPTLFEGVTDRGEVGAVTLTTDPRWKPPFSRWWRGVAWWQLHGHGYVYRSELAEYNYEPTPEEASRGFEKGGNWMTKYVGRPVQDWVWYQRQVRGG
ncbi:hypothetical protein BDV95DRAFT_599412 [Massariosphaeria phaeospora]|uniref:Uncharacterized protein n=1 Tax=Massariosphaeria phaeospora TaxID=100035 RepID=A0A7C8HZ19_9PLEO|nr:hypothetical protein BDV95DRAFT_599412 [Massariosphaeria phaeospora]